jgi:hypothetical protein
MRINISYTALGLALLAGTTAANAQTVITREISDHPVETVVTPQPGGTLIAQKPLVAAPAETVVTQPVQTVQTTETVRTIRPGAKPVVRRRVVTTRQTVVSLRIVPTQTVVAPPAPAIAGTTVAAYRQPLYDTVLPAANDAVVAPPASVSTALPSYRYVYEPDRILVIDPATGIAIQALPR